ncbi:MAG: type II secretion system F family protein [Nanopusillaceae archaeon]
MLRLKERIKKIYKDNKNLIAYTYFKKYSFDDYVDFSLKLSILMSILSAIIISIIIYLITNFIDIVIILISIFFGIFVFFLVIFYFYIYPILAKEDYKRDIDVNIPFFILYFYVYASSNVNMIDIFRFLSTRKEFGNLRNEIKFLINLIDMLGYDLTNALLVLANKTPSYKLKEFLYGLYSTIKSGGSILEFIKIYSKNSMKEYEIILKSYNEKINTLITVYSFIFSLFPLTLLIISFIISYISGNVALLNQLLFFYTIILPLSYIAYLYFIHTIQPKI